MASLSRVQVSYVPAKSVSCPPPTLKNSPAADLSIHDKRGPAGGAVKPTWTSYTPPALLGVGGVGALAQLSPADSPEVVLARADGAVSALQLPASPDPLLSPPLALSHQRPPPLRLVNRPKRKAKPVVRRSGFADHFVSLSVRTSPSAQLLATHGEPEGEGSAEELELVFELGGCPLAGLQCYPLPCESAKKATSDDGVVGEEKGSGSEVKAAAAVSLTPEERLRAVDKQVGQAADRLLNNAVKAGERSLDQARQLAYKAASPTSALLRTDPRTDPASSEALLSSEDSSARLLLQGACVAVRCFPASRGTFDAQMLVKFVLSTAPLVLDARAWAARGREPQAPYPEYFAVVLTNEQGHRMYASCLHYYSSSALPRSSATALRTGEGGAGELLYEARCLLLLAHEPFLASQRAVRRAAKIRGSILTANPTSPLS
jgi:hypothetical protein